MSVTRNLMFNAYSGAVAAAVAVVGHKLVESLWTSITGEEPPDPNNPSTPPNQAFAWVLANAIGIGVLGVAANRFSAARWVKFSGEELSTSRTVNLKL